MMVKSIDAALLRKGFVCDNTHHELYWLYVNGRKTSIRTRISHGAREYHDGLLAAMAREMKLVRREFDNFVECTLSEAEYVRLLRARGLVRSE